MIANIHADKQEVLLSLVPRTQPSETFCFPAHKSAVHRISLNSD